MATMPVNHIDSIHIELENSNGESRRQWTRAVLYKGIFAASYRLSSTSTLGKWAIKVTAIDGVIPNEKLQQFEVREYVMPKFVVKVVPSRILLISDKEISLSVESHYTFGGPVRGVVHVKLFTDDNLRAASHSNRRNFDGNGTFSFMLKKELTNLFDDDYVMVRANVSLTDEVFSVGVGFASTVFTQAELDLLNKGLNFAIAPQCAPLADIVANIESAIQYDNNTLKSATRHCVQQCLSRTASKRNSKICPNFDDWCTIRLLKSRNVIYSRADKGNAVVIMDRGDYDSRVLAMIRDGPYEEYKFKNGKPKDPLNDQSRRTMWSTHHTRRQPSEKSLFYGTGYAESWFWKNYTMRNHMFLTVSDVIPHTITSWYVTGFALSPTRGLGLVNAPAKLTVSKPFYIITNLPYSIKRFEVVRIQVTLFNFLNDSLPTIVTLYNQGHCDEFEFVERTSNDKNRLQLKSETVFFNHDSYRTQQFCFLLDTPMAAEQVSGKIRAMIDPISALFMSTTVQNLNSLFIIPAGTASSNLLNMNLKVFALDYMKETNKTDSSIEQEANDYLFTEYIKLLKYRQSNGAFSQWNQPQKKPSIFLTAQVANAFGTTSKHIKISQAIITKAFSWIKDKQKRNGCFEEDGEIIHERLQSSSSSFALTAFVIAAIQENNATAIQFSDLVEKAKNCLANNFDSLTNTYDRALATYALSLTRHVNRQGYLNKLIEEVRYGAGGYWNGELSVEITGYTILSLLAQHMYREAFAIMNWFNEQRYSTEVFSGVHSTFVALKVFGHLAEYLNRVQNDISVYKTERVFNNTAIFVYYDEVSTDQKCFEVTAHRKYPTALHRPSYVVVYDINDMDKHAIKTYEDKVQENESGEQIDEFLGIICEG
nr:CD109 antigen-like [Aedes albopictus]